VSDLVASATDDCDGNVLSNVKIAGEIQSFIGFARAAKI
jgi:hypothetical protein